MDWQRYGDLFLRSFSDYARYLIEDITHPSWHSYFYGLILLSVVVYLLELRFPWREQQPKIRRDFWIDGFYMFFNFFLFSLLGYDAVSKVVATAFRDAQLALGIEEIAFSVAGWPVLMQLAVMFIVRDFIHYGVHRLLHHVPGLWEFHKVHHSVTEMGFSAHLRYHFVETVVYRTIEFIPLGLIGFGVQEFFFVHMLALTIGHLNHANLYLPIGPLRYVLNTPQMHIWHHYKTPPRRYGANFGISLSVWDWLFGTVYWPSSGRDIVLGFEDVETFPKGFVGHLVEPFAALRRKRQKS